MLIRYKRELRTLLLCSFFTFPFPQREPLSLQPKPLKAHFIPVVKNIYYFNMWLFVKRKSEWGKRERIILFIILLGSIYYFTGLYIKIKMVT